MKEERKELDRFLNFFLCSLSPLSLSLSLSLSPIFLFSLFSLYLIYLASHFISLPLTLSPSLFQIHALPLTHTRTHTCRIYLTIFCWVESQWLTYWTATDLMSSNSSRTIALTFKLIGKCMKPLTILALCQTEPRGLQGC